MFYLHQESSYVRFGQGCSVTKERFDIKYALAEAVTDLSNRWNEEDQSEEIFFGEKELGGLHCWWDPLPSKPGLDWWNKTLIYQGHEYKKPFAIVIISSKETWGLM